MKVLLNDGLDSDGIRLFQEAGIETDTRKRDLADLVRESGDFDAIIVRSATEVRRNVLEEGYEGNLKIVGRAGVGYDNIDVDAASEKGIVVKIAPFGNTNAAAEITHGLMLAVARNIPQAHYSLVNGIWRKKPYAGVELSHKVLGIIGCGRIGQRISHLVIGYDMEVIGCDANLEVVKAFFPNSRIDYVPFEEVIRRADFLTVHAGGGERPIIGENELTMMQPHSFLINTSRGSNVDERALYKWLEERRIRGAALDVHQYEPKTEDSRYESKFKGLPNVVLTSHLGASTKEAQRETSTEIARVTISYLLHGDLTNAINIGESVEAKGRPVFPLFIHHRDEVGAFLAIDGVLARNGISIKQNTSGSLKGQTGLASTVYEIYQPAKPEVLRQLNSLSVVLRARNGVVQY